jgi:hypothetical protein
MTMQSRIDDITRVNKLTSIDDYFPLCLEQTLQLYALRMKDDNNQVDTIVSIDDDNAS